MLVTAFIEEVRARGAEEADLVELMTRPHTELDRAALDAWFEATAPRYSAEDLEAPE